MFFYKSGEFYYGDWKNNRKHGYGIYFYANGHRYFGNIKIIMNIQTLKGEWMLNQRHGKGKYVSQDKLIYEGNFCCNKKDGKGQEINSNGEVFEELWMQGVLMSRTMIKHDK